jgi:hypothetical protein
MPRLYACIVSDENKEEVTSVARQFAYGIELIGDAVLFDISGTKNIFGSPSQIAQKIYDSLQKRKLSGNVSVASNAAAALLHARNQRGISVVNENEPADLPLSTLDIDPDTLDVFHSLGIKDIAGIRRIGENELITRYGPEFRNTIDLAKNKGKYVLTPNLKENKITWRSELDFSVADFEQLIFLLSNGLEKLLAKASYLGFSTEQIDITLRLGNKTSKTYNIKLSFPTLERKFWLIVINLRIAGDPPEAEIVSVDLTICLTRPRAVQRGLFSSTKPEPEDLQLTVDKIKNLVGIENVGIPVLLDRRLPKAFMLDPGTLPLGKEELKPVEPKLALTLSYFDPPLEAEVVVNKKTLLYVRTQSFEGRVNQYGGVWKGSSQWWSLRRWKDLEWDIELEDQSLYRLQGDGRKWLVTGKYD